MRANRALDGYRSVQGLEFNARTGELWSTVMDPRGGDALDAKDTIFPVLELTPSRTLAIVAEDAANRLSLSDIDDAIFVMQRAGDGRAR